MRGLVFLSPWPPLAYEIQDAADRVLVTWDGARTVAVPRRLFVKFMHSQAARDWSGNVCARVCVAAYHHPRLMGAELLVSPPSVFLASSVGRAAAAAV